MRWIPANIPTFRITINKVMPTPTNKQARTSEAKRKENGEERVSATGWVEAEHRAKATAEGQAAFKKAIKKYQR